MSYHSVSCSRHVVRDIPTTYLSHNWKFVFLTTSHQSPFPHPLSLVTTSLISFYMSLIIVLDSIYE